MISMKEELFKQLKEAFPSFSIVSTYPKQIKQMPVIIIQETQNTDWRIEYTIHLFQDNQIEFSSVQLINSIFMTEGFERTSAAETPDPDVKHYILRFGKRLPF